MANEKSVHLIGVCGTGMGALAGLFAEAGYEVRGSDRAFYAPMSEWLVELGVKTMRGFSAENIAAHGVPDVVVVGNMCRPDNAEALEAMRLRDEGKTRVLSFPAAIGSMYLKGRPSVVVAGTHGKTTTTSLTAFLLRESGLMPGWLVGGIPRDLGRPSKLGADSAPFVIEGDEYDSAYFEKTPKCWQYVETDAGAKAVILTSIEHDHLDIYPDEASYVAAFEGLIERLCDDTLLVAYAGDKNVRKVAARARCQVRYYALLDDDTGDVSPIWLGALAPPIGGFVPIDLYGGGTYLGRIRSPLSGKHNARNLVAALAVSTEACGADLSKLLDVVPSFSGVARRQELVCIADDVRVFEDFAHHPTAVRTTLQGVRELHPPKRRSDAIGRLVAVFEPRSATASRRLHQAEYESAFAAADVVLLAPVGRAEIPEADRLDTAQLAAALQERGKEAHALSSIDDTLNAALEVLRPGDVVVLMSNGAFGDLPDRLAAELVLRARL